MDATGPIQRKAGQLGKGTKTFERQGRPRLELGHNADLDPILICFQKRQGNAAQSAKDSHDGQHTDVPDSCLDDVLNRKGTETM